MPVSLECVTPWFRVTKQAPQVRGRIAEHSHPVARVVCTAAELPGALPKYPLTGEYDSTSSY